MDIEWEPQAIYYVYNADTYCMDCGHNIHRELLDKRWNIYSIDELPTIPRYTAN